MTTFPEAIEHYKEHLAGANLAERTRAEYVNDIVDLAAFLVVQEIIQVEHLAQTSLEAFLAELDHRQLSGYTRRRKVSSIKSFCHFLTVHGSVSVDPAYELKAPKREETLPRVLSEAEYQRLQLTVAHQPLAAAMIEVLLQTGIRLSELANLALSDVQLPAKISKDVGSVGSLFIHKGKGRKDRVITLNYKACRAVKAYIKVRPKVETNALFISKFGRGITPRGIEWLVDKYLKEAGIVGAHTHTLRHTFGTMQARKKTSMLVIQGMLGHKSLETTKLYITLARETMDKEIQEHAL